MYVQKQSEVTSQQTECKTFSRRKAGNIKYVGKKKS
jgi:hypothetical protein